MRNTVGISHRLKRAWLDDLLDRLVQTRDEREVRAFVDQRLRDELPGKDARAKAAGILLRIWSGVEPKHVALRDRAITLLPRISGQERIWLHWGMAALAYPFFRDLAEVIGRMLALQDDITNAQVQTRLKAAWGDRETSREAAGKLITSMVDWEVLRATKTKGHFLLARKMTTTVTELQLWLLEAMLSASASDEIEAQQLLRLPELFPFSLTVSVGDLRKHDGFNINRQGLDMDMVSMRQVRIEPPTLPAKQKKPKKLKAEEEQPTLFVRPVPSVPVDVDATPQPDETSHRALVVVRNLIVPTDRIDMGEFVLTRVGLQFKDLRQTLSTEDVFQHDWLLEKTYARLPGSIGPAPSGLGGIPNDIEDILFLLRLFKVGDVAFVRQAVVKPDGETLTQYPYHMMNSLNSDSVLTTDLGVNDPEQWQSFADGLRKSQSWGASWFLVARRFFLYGGAKEFNPGWDEVDRMVDYATALEAILVPEGEFSRSCCAKRAAALCSTDPDEQKSVAALVKKLYDLRSCIVHGSILGQEDRSWMRDKSHDIEARVREVIVAAARLLPPDDVGRTALLKSLFDVTDGKRGEFALQKFKEIETAEVRNATEAAIAKFQAKSKRCRTDSESER